MLILDEDRPIIENWFELRTVVNTEVHSVDCATSKCLPVSLILRGGKRAGRCHPCKRQLQGSSPWGWCPSWLRPGLSDPEDGGRGAHQGEEMEEDIIVQASFLYIL